MVLSDIFLAQGNRILESVLPDLHVQKCFRYVDDFLVCLKPGTDIESSIPPIIAAFESAHQGLDFTYEKPVNDAIQFLDINLKTGLSHTCWCYRTRGEKALLPYDSAHSKLIKRAIATSCMSQAIKKSCEHRVTESLSFQIDRLTKSGFTNQVLVSVAEKVLKTVVKKINKEKDSKKPKKRPIVLQYIHKFSHRLKKVGTRHDVPVVFSAPKKLKMLCKMTNKTRDAKQTGCGIKHTSKFVACCSGVVYRIPLSCKKAYIGQTGRCVNERLREHKNMCKQVSAPGHLAAHCARHGCSAKFESTTILFESSETITREIWEAYAIRKEKDCISSPSIALSTTEMALLDSS